MAEAIEFETRQYCAQLWIEDGQTYEAVAARTGVSVGALKKWADDEGWADKRRDYREALREIRANTTKLRRALITKALGSLNAQDVYAVTSLETVMARAAGKAPAAGDLAPIAPDNLREIKTPQQAIDALQDACERKINGMLAAGDIDLDKIKNVKQSLELLDKMRAQYINADAQPAAQKELNPETMQQIKDLYGVK